MARLHALRSAIQVLRILPPNVKAVVYAFSGAAIGWTAHELLNVDQGKGRRTESQVAKVQLTETPESTRILGQASPPSAFVRRVGANFIAEVDPTTHNPRWVAELLTADSIHGPAVHRQGVAFHEEPGVPAHQRVRLSDYAGSGYDRGHMAAAANHRTSDASLADTFYLSNIAPQCGAGLNRDWWARLEAFVRGLTKDWDEVRVITGPLYLPDPTGRTPRTLTEPESSEGMPSPPPPTAWSYRFAALGHAPTFTPVPTHFFKVVLVTRKDSGGSGGGGGRGVVEAAAAFVVPNTPIMPQRPVTDFLVPFRTLESLSGLQLYRERLGDEGLADVDAGLGTALRLSADPVSAQTAVAVHVARALSRQSSRGTHMEGGNGGGGRDKKWPPVLAVPAPVPRQGKVGAPAGPRAWHLCALTPCGLSDLTWARHEGHLESGPSSTSDGAERESQHKKRAGGSSRQQ